MARSSFAALVLGISLLGSSVALAQFSGNVIRLGVLNDQSGPVADVAGEGSAVAARLAIEDMGGNIMGRPIELLSSDHQNKLDVAMSIANKWIDVDGLDAFAEISNSGVALAIQDLIRVKKRIALISSAAASAVTDKACSPYGFHGWALDSYVWSAANVQAVMNSGGNKKDWYFITTDLAFGNSVQAEIAEALLASGGRVVGGVKVPFGNKDFSSFLLQAQASKAPVIAMVVGADDLAPLMKQADEFGVAQGGQTILTPIATDLEVHQVGLQSMKGTYLVMPFVWNQNAQTRAFSERYQKARRRPPHQYQAGTYSAVRHYLEAVKAAGTDDTDAVAAKMRQMPINDFMTKDGTIRADGHVMREQYLFQVKSPAESQGAWDYVKELGVISRDIAARPVEKSQCALLKK